MSSLKSPSHSTIKEQEYLPCRVKHVVITMSSDSCSVFSKQEKSWEARAKTEILPLEALLLPLIFMQTSGCSLQQAKQFTKKTKTNLLFHPNLGKPCLGGNSGKFLSWKPCKAVCNPSTAQILNACGFPR